MNSAIVVISRAESAIAGSRLFDRASGAADERRKVLDIIKVRQSKSLVRQQNGGASVNYVMDKDLAPAQAISKRLDLVCGPKRKIVIGHRYANAAAVSQEFDQPGNVDAGADIEVRLVKAAEEFKYFASGPGCGIQIVWHGGERVVRKQVSTAREE